MVIQDNYFTRTQQMWPVVSDCHSKRFYGINGINKNFVSQEGPDSGGFLKVYVQDR